MIIVPNAIAEAYFELPRIFKIFLLETIRYDLLGAPMLSKFQCILGKTFYPNPYHSYIYLLHV